MLTGYQNRQSTHAEKGPDDEYRTTGRCLGRVVSISSCSEGHETLIDILSS